MAIPLQLRSALLRAAVIWFCFFAPVSARPEVVDRIAAVIDDELITLSDVKWLIEYRGQQVPDDPAQRATFYRGILDQLINQRLIVKETAKTPFIQVSEEEVSEFAENYRRRFAGEEEFQAKLGEMGMKERDLMRLFRRQLIVNRFIELRFEPFIIVLPGGIREYYETEFLPEVEAGQEPPPLEIVEETIRQILTVRRTTQQLEGWVDNNLANSEVKILLFRDPEWAPNLPDALVGEVELRPMEISKTPSSNQ